MRGVEVKWLKEIEPFTTAEPRRQSVRSESDKILVGICRANDDVVDTTIGQYLTRSQYWRQHEREHREVAIVIAMVGRCKNGVIGLGKNRRPKIDRCHHTSPWKSCHGSDIGHGLARRRISFGDCHRRLED